jgi:hypothetical protein
VCVFQRCGYGLLMLYEPNGRHFREGIAYLDYEHSDG